MTHYKTLWCRQNHSTDGQIKYLLMLAMITCHGFGFQFSYFPVLNWKTRLSFISLIYTSCLCLLPACFLCSPVFRLLISPKATNIKGLFKWQWFENDFCSALLCEGSRAVNLCMFREKGCWLLSLWAIGCASLHCSRSPPFVLHWFVKALNGIHRWFFFLFFFYFYLHNPIPTLVADGQLLQVSCGRRWFGRGGFYCPGHNGTSACPHETERDGERNHSA